MKKKLAIIIGVALIIFTMFNIFKVNVFLNNSNNNFIDIYKNQLKFIYSSNGEIINGNIKVYNKEKKSFLLREILGNSPKLVFRYSELNCDVCVDLEVKKIKKMAKVIGENNVLMLANYRDLNSLLIFKKIHNLSIPVYNLENQTLGLSVDKINTPYLFVSDSSLATKSMFIPNKKYPNISDIYYEVIKKKYFE